MSRRRTQRGADMAEGARDPSGEGMAGVVLCADDFAMTNGISRALIELAEAGRLSAVSAMTTTAHWPSHATWLARARGRIAAGLHLNLTLGAPLGAMERFAPGRRFPVVREVTLLALQRGIDRGELGAEIERQLVAFEAEIGFAPDHIDGHQHVHALPVVRDVLLKVIARRYPSSGPRPLLRSPADAAARIVRRGVAASKALKLAALSAGFAGAARASGFEANEGFSGVTGFATDEVAADFQAACRQLGPHHLIMCHPGFVDDELVRIDPVQERRQREFEFLLGGRFELPIWRPQRSAMGPAIDWAAEWAGTA